MKKNDFNTWVSSWSWVLACGSDVMRRLKPRALFLFVGLFFFFSDRAHIWRARQQGQHHLPGHAEGHHLAEGRAHQEVTNAMYSSSSIMVRNGPPCLQAGRQDWAA